MHRGIIIVPKNLIFKANSNKSVYNLETTTSLNRRRRDQPTNNNTSDYHHPHYNHHRTSSSKGKEYVHSSQKVKSSANTSYQNKLSFNQNDPKGKDITEEKNSSPLYMQNVITSTSLSNNGRLESDNETITHDEKVCGDRKMPISTHQIRGTSSEPRPTHSNDASVDLDQHYTRAMADDNAKSSGGIVRRTKNMVIASSAEPNSKPPTHESYQIEELL